MIIELNEAYEVLSDPNTKWIYDHHFAKKDEVFIPEQVIQEDTRKRRKGSKETETQKQEKRAFAIKRNTAFNRKMKLFSVVSLLFAAVIFVDHYLPPSTIFETVYAAFKPEEIHPFSESSVAVFLNNGKKLELFPSGLNEEAMGLRKGEALFYNTPIFNVLRTVQVGKLILKPFDGLYNIMLIYGAVCISSLFVLGYKLEESLVLPTILTFFNNMLVLTFFTMWFMES